MTADRTDVSPAVAEQNVAVRRLTTALRERAGRVRYRMPVEARNVLRWADQIDATASRMMRAARVGDQAAVAAAWRNLRAAGVLIHAASAQTSDVPCLTTFDDESIRACALTVADNADRGRAVETDPPAP